MANEIERKFLVEDTRCVKEAYRTEHIEQGYLLNKARQVVRVRTVQSSQTSQGYITIKISTADALVRREYEFPISFYEAEEMLRECSDVIKKTRHYIAHGEGTFEVDRFHGKNDGLWLAEMEFPNLEAAKAWQEYLAPRWLGKEVTKDFRYANSELAKHPYTEWETK